MIAVYVRVNSVTDGLVQLGIAAVAFAVIWAYSWWKDRRR